MSENLRPSNQDIKGDQRPVSKKRSSFRGGREEGPGSRNSSIALGPADILVTAGSSAEVIRGQLDRAKSYLTERGKPVWVHAIGVAVPQAIVIVGKLEKELGDLEAESFTSTRDCEFGQQGPKSESAVHVKLTPKGVHK